MTSTTNDLVARRPRRQLTLAGLLSLMVASSVYFAMVSSLRPLFSNHRDGPYWPIPITIMIAWGVLWALYRRWGLRQAVVVHFSGPVMALGLLAIFAVVGLIAWLADWPPKPLPIFEFLLAALSLFLAGCGMSTAVSLPAAMLMMLYLCLATETTGGNVH